MSSDFDFNTEREVEQLLIAIEFHLKEIRELDAYIEKLEEARTPGTGKTDKSYQVIKLAQKRETHKDRIIGIVSQIQGLKTEAEKEDELDEDLFNPDEQFPPQFHLDNLESKLDFNLGQVDRFFELDWSSKCDLAKIAVENDLDRESTETIVQMSLASAGDASC